MQVFRRSGILCLPWSREVALGYDPSNNGSGVFQVAQLKNKQTNKKTNAGDAGSIPCQEDPLEKKMATLSSILAWEIPCTEESGGLQSMGSQRVRYDLAAKQEQQQQ